MNGSGGVVCVKGRGYAPVRPPRTGPVNVTAHPVDGAPSGSFDQLRAAGVRRITFGPLLMAALTDTLTDLVTPWR